MTFLFQLIINRRVLAESGSEMRFLLRAGSVEKLLVTVNTDRTVGLDKSGLDP